MNVLLFDENELLGSTLHLKDRRATHITGILHSKPGDTLRVGMINGLGGTGRVLKVEDSEVILDVQLTSSPAPKMTLDLILALPRPIMLKRILKQATVLGVRSIHLIRSQRVEKSFFHSPVLQPENMRNLLIEGLEQAMDTKLPTITIHHRFKPFIEDVVPAMNSAAKLLAHPGEEGTLTDLYGADVSLDNNVLAVGPEGGWNDYEVDCFYDAGFHGFSMGPRILHVDTAVVALLSQLQVLHDLRNF
ncbi:MAG: 16S rRNA (uracil(1498)-N(3))-methyltransferase [Desulfobulbaceae bacterium]|nr:16S rRNA (uracil(1498)-N(3))-methyltransferase [Desulfobulbaceae bacterium]